MFMQFRETISRSGEGLRIMILPYGEALIHPYYQEGIAGLANLPNVLGISCQTNLSFNVKQFVSVLPSEVIGKIKLWASFHPEMVSVDNFVKKAHYLFDNGIELCVGVVGHPENKEIIRELREELRADIYLFINSMRGIAHRLKTEDISFFTSIDNLFGYDRKQVKADIQKCKGGRETIFIDESGNWYACPRSGVKMTDQPVCKRKVCDCYIAYSNNNSVIQDIMGNGFIWRIPQKQKVSAMFFDIDGTLTDSQGAIPDSYIKSLKWFSSKIPLFLATALPLSFAKRKLGSSMKLFSGGVFADGAHLLSGKEEEYIALTPPDLNRNFKISAYRNKIGETYKLALTAKSEQTAQSLYNKLKDNYNAYLEGKLLTITDKKADKQKGVLAICKKRDINLSQVMVMGDTLRDWPMMSVAGYSCAVLDSCDELKSKAKMVLNPNQLTFWFC